MCASPPFAATKTTPRVTLPHRQQGTDTFLSLASHVSLFARATGASASEARPLARAARNARYSPRLFRGTNSGVAAAPCPSPSPTLSAETPPLKESVARLSLEQPDSTQAFLSCEQPLVAPESQRAESIENHVQAPVQAPCTGACTWCGAKLRMLRAWPHVQAPVIHMSHWNRDQISIPICHWSR